MTNTNILKKKTRHSVLDTESQTRTNHLPQPLQRKGSFSPFGRLRGVLAILTLTIFAFQANAQSGMTGNLNWSISGDTLLTITGNDTNVVGQIVGTWRATSNETTIDISNLANGMYSLKIQTRNSIITQKVIKN